MAQAPSIASGYKNGSSPNGNMLTGLAALASLGLALVSIFITNGQSTKGDIGQVKQESREDLRRAEERWERELQSVKWTIDNKLLTVPQHVEFASRIDKTADILRDEINKIRTDQVSRSEHVQHWAEIAERINALNLRIKDVSAEQNAVNESMRKEFGSTFTAGDQMKNLQDQIKTLQNRFDAIGSKNSSSVPTTMGNRLNPTSF